MKSFVVFAALCVFIASASAASLYRKLESFFAKLDLRALLSGMKMPTCFHSFQGERCFI